MRLGWHVRGWLLLFLAALTLLMVVGIPAGLQQRGSKQAAFVGTMIPITTVLYGMLAFVLFHRPLVVALRAYRQNREAAGPPSGRGNGWSKELRKVDRAVGVILREREQMLQFLAARGEAAGGEGNGSGGAVSAELPPASARLGASASSVQSAFVAAVAASASQSTPAPRRRAAAQSVADGTGTAAAHEPVTTIEGTPPTVARDVSSSVDREGQSTHYRSHLPRGGGSGSFAFRRKARMSAVAPKQVTAVPSSAPEEPFYEYYDANSEKASMPVFSHPGSDVASSLHSFPPSDEDE